MEEDRTKPAAPASAIKSSAINCTREKLERRSTNGSIGSGGAGGGGGADLSEENVDAFYKKMLVRAPNKRQIKPVNRKELLNRLDLKKFEKPNEQSDSESDEDFKLNEKDKGHSSGSDENSDSDKDGGESDEDSDEEKTEGGSDGDEELDGGGRSVSDNENAKFDAGSRISLEDTEVQLSTDNSTIGFSTGESTPRAISDDPFTVSKAAASLASVTASRLPASLPTSSILICTVCLKQTSEVNDEIVECDACGVCVHEGCYGVSDTQSIASTDSSASTEPWFCDSCKAGVSDPVCQVCPNRGGIFKETDMGDWIHMICALYVPGIAFSNVDTLSNVTLFEISSSRFGAKECQLCEEESMNRTGITFGCDAGLCRAHFHATCAQRQGLLSETRPQEGAAPGELDPYWASCKQHVDKDVARANRRNWTAARALTRCFKSRHVDDAVAHERVKRKLAKRQNKFAISRGNRLPTWIPAQKMARALESSPSAVEMLHRKAEQMGIGVSNSQAHRKHTLDLQVDEGKKKGFVAPAFSVEFMTYFSERTRRIEEAKEAQRRLEEANVKLKREEFALRHQYEVEIHKAEERKKEIKGTQDAFINLWRLVECVSGRTFELPKSLRRQRRRISGKGPNSHLLSPTGAPPSSVKVGTSESKQEKTNLTPKVSPRALPMITETGSDPTTKPSASTILLSPSTSSLLVSSQESSPDKGGVESLLRQCKNCSGKQEQFNMIDCDDCKEWYHLGCLEPPLTRMPKKTKKFGWACSECTGDSDDPKDEEEKLLLKAKEPRQLRNNRKKPKKFSDGESLVSPGKEDKDSTEGGGKLVDGKKSSAASRELSRLGDDVVVATGPRSTRGKKQATPSAPALPSSSLLTHSAKTSEFLPNSNKTPSLSSPQPSPTCQSLHIPSLNSLETTSQPAQLAAQNRSRRRSSRGVKAATTTVVAATTKTAPDSLVTLLSAGTATTTANEAEDLPTSSFETPPVGVDRGLLTSMTEFIESLVESSKTKKKQRRLGHPTPEDVTTTSNAADTTEHCSHNPQSGVRASKRSTRSLGKATNSKLASIVSDVPSTEGDEDEGVPPHKRGRGWVEDEPGENASATLKLSDNAAPSLASASRASGAPTPSSPPSFPSSDSLVSSLTPIPSPTETNSVGGGETSSTSNDAAESGGGVIIETARKDRREEEDEENGVLSRKASDSLKSTTASSVISADYAKALAFSPPRLNSSSTTVASCFSSPFHHRYNNHSQSASVLNSAPPNNHLFPAPPKLKLTSSPPDVSSTSSFSSSLAKAAGFSSPSHPFSSPSHPFSSRNPLFSSQNPFSSFSMTASSPECGVVAMTSPIRGKFMNLLEIRVHDEAVVGGGGGGEGDLVDIAAATPALLSPTSPRRAGGGGSVSPRVSWKSPKKSGKTKNRQSRRSGDTDTSIEILTSFDQLTLAPPLPTVNDDEGPRCSEMQNEDSMRRPQHQPQRPHQSQPRSGLPASLFAGSEKPQKEEAASKFFSDSTTPLPRPLLALSTSSSSSSSSISLSSLTTATTSTTTTKSEIAQKREKRENFFCDFKSIPKFPKISSTKSDFHLPPSIFAAAAAAAASAVTASDPADRKHGVEDHLEGVSKLKSENKIASGMFSGQTPVFKKRLLNGDKCGVMSALTVDTKSSDEYDFISSPERTPSPIKAFASPPRERKSSAEERRALDFDPENAHDDEDEEDYDGADDIRPKISTNSHLNSSGTKATSAKALTSGSQGPTQSLVEVVSESTSRHDVSCSSLKALSPLLSPPLPTTNPVRKQVDLQMAKMQQRAPSKRQIKMKRRFSLDEEERRIELEKQQQQQQLRKGGRVDSNKEEEEEEQEDEKCTDSPSENRPKKSKALKKTAMTNGTESLQPALSNGLSEAEYSALPAATTDAKKSPPLKKRSPPSAPLVCRKCEKRTGPKTSFVTCSDCFMTFHQSCVLDEDDAEKNDADKWTTTKKTPPKRRSLKSFRGWKCLSCRGKSSSSIENATDVTPSMDALQEDSTLVSASKIQGQETGVNGPSQETPRRPSLGGEDGEKTNPFATESFEDVCTSKRDGEIGTSEKPAESGGISALSNGIPYPKERGIGTSGIESADNSINNSVSDGTEVNDSPSSAQEQLPLLLEQQPTDGLSASSAITPLTQTALASASSSPRYDCDRCSKSFTNKAHVNRHVQSVHLKIQHQCDHCGKKFTRKDRLTEHLKQAHTQPGSSDDVNAGVEDELPSTPLLIHSPLREPMSPMQKQSTPESPSFINSLDDSLAVNVNASNVSIKS